MQWLGCIEESNRCIIYRKLFLLHHVPFHDRFPSHRTFCRPRRNGIHRFWPSEANNPGNHGGGGCFLCPNDPIKHTSHRCNSLRNRCRADAFIIYVSAVVPFEEQGHSRTQALCLMDGSYIMSFPFVQQLMEMPRGVFSLRHTE